MALTERELEERLLEAGKRLLQPPSSADELLPLLDRVESFLSMVEQSPSRAMLNNLSPTMKALVTDEYLRNPNEDVKVAAASCISEITRITAPDAPYDDEQMKKVFQLIVSSFGNLSDKSSHSYGRRILILETVAKVRSCVVMLDLECDDLIIEMFQHFLKAIRDHHPKNVFSSMETIMTLVLEESEDVALDVISPLLASLKKDNQDVHPIAQKLAENVFRNCSAKVKPCLIQAKSSLNFSFDDYNPIISKICKGTSHVAEHDNHLSSEEQLDQVTKEIITETLGRKDHHASLETGSYEHHAAPVESGPGKDNSAPMETGDHPALVETGTGEGHHAPEMSPKSVTSNGIAENKNEDASADPYSLERIEHANKGHRSPDANVADATGSADTQSRKVAKVVPKSTQSKKRSRKARYSIKSAVPFESSHIDTVKANKLITEVDRNPDKEVHVSPSKDPSIHVVVPKENKKGTKQVSPSPSGSVLEEDHSQKDSRSKKKKKLREESPSENAATKKASEGTEVTELKLRSRSDKNTFASDTPVTKAQVPSKKSNVEGGSGSISSIKVVEKSAKKVNPKDHIWAGSSSKKKADGQRHVNGQTTLEKDPVSSPNPSKVVKGVSPLEEAPKRSSKRKSTTSKEKVTDMKEYGEYMIGARVKVWWPLDKMFYEGVIDSFDHTRKKHKVLYNDGDFEVLNLRDEKWELTGGEVPITDEGQEIRVGSSNTSPEMQRKKKAKTRSKQSSKKGKMAGTSRRGEASSDRSKGAAIESGRKAVNRIKDNYKLADATQKSSVQSEDVKDKSKVRSKRGSAKPAVDGSEKASKSKDENGGISKPSIKFKMGSPKTIAKDGSKTATKDSRKSVTKETSKTTVKSTSKSTARNAPQSAVEDTPKSAMKDSLKTVVKNSKKIGLRSKTSKSESKSSGTVKSGSVKGKEAEDEEKSPDVVKASESENGKSPERSNGKQTGGKSGKKRRRGIKN